MSRATGSPWKALLADSGHLVTHAPLGIGPVHDIVELHQGELSFAWSQASDRLGPRDISEVYRAAIKPPRLVKWPRSLLERFLGLRTDRTFHQFASQYGALGLFPHLDAKYKNGLRPDPQQLAVWATEPHREPINTWKDIQSDFQALVRLAALLHDEQTPLAPTVLEIVTLVKAKDVAGPDWRTWSHRRQRLFASELFQEHTDRFTRWCLIGPSVSLFDHAVVFCDNSYSSGPNRYAVGHERLLSLFGALTVQLIAAATTRGFAICSSCGLPFVPGARQPAIGRRRYCIPCRKDGAPHRDAARDFRRKR